MSLDPEDDECMDERENRNKTKRKLTAYPKRVCQTLHQCCVCDLHILFGQHYYDAMNTFQESARCPVCLTVGRMFFQYGSYCCPHCDRCWEHCRLEAWMQAFEQGREYERQNNGGEQRGPTI